MESFADGIERIGIKRPDIPFLLKTVASRPSGNLLNLCRKQFASAQAIKLVVFGKEQGFDGKVESHRNGIGRDQYLALSLPEASCLLTPDLRREIAVYDRDRVLLGELLFEREHVSSGKSDNGCLRLYFFHGNRVFHHCQLILAFKVNDLQLFPKIFTECFYCMQSIEGTGKYHFFGRYTDECICPGPASVTVRDHLYLIDDTDIDIYRVVHHFYGRRDMGRLFVDDLLLPGNERDMHSLFFEILIPLKGKQTKRREVVPSRGFLQGFKRRVGLTRVGRPHMKYDLAFEFTRQGEEVLEVTDGLGQKLFAFLLFQKGFDVFTKMKEYPPSALLFELERM